ncbi:glycoside hydrolase family 16 protein [Tulasnella calospora MUT 4182]|uniref:Glycoside hydrolase family 16 protein n=1 Tax=Tulasnella calospora MUT 4182 TaxID=1051891 RepID=A0A0C3QGV1_9AGAM|nr:glycoside hydrolase family 16 protein [Tulasnella calospora MUT 4182]
MYFPGSAGGISALTGEPRYPTRRDFLQWESGDKFIVPPPFEASSPGDCILQSVEDVQFKVFRQILVLASPVMADMFSLPQKEAETKSNAAPLDHLPLISLAEDAETIHNLLLLLYPTSFPDKLEVQEAIKLAKVYDKYLIPKTRLRLAIGPLYNSRSTLENSPLELYRLAWELEMMSEAAIASRFTHKIAFKDLYIALPMEAFEKLLDLRKRREEGLDGLIAVLEPRKSICEADAGNDFDFFCQIAALKDLAKTTSSEDSGDYAAVFGLYTLQVL